MVRVRLSTAAAGLAGVLLLVWLWSGWDAGGGLPLGRRAPAPLPEPLPRIGLERIGAERVPGATGRRDVFAYGPVQAVGATPPPPAVDPDAARPMPTPGPRPAPRQAPAASVPSMNVAFIGVVEGPGGLRVAVLEAEGRDVLTGREGDLVANRLEIVKIGLESLDVRDVGSERVRRIPLEGGR